MKKVIAFLILLFCLFCFDSSLAFEKFPVLEYHLIGRPEGRWQRTPENFLRDLEWLHRHGYYPMNLRDLLSDFPGLPAGKTPVVLTFDDSSSGQFRYLSDGRIDPDCAVGIINEFSRRHPDWPRRATFFVLIASSAPDRNLFGQPEHAARKIRQLTEWGMEIGSHTYSHDRFDRMSSRAARRSIERSVKKLESLSGQKVVSLALPLGIYPDDMSILSRFKLVAGVAGGFQSRPGGQARQRRGEKEFKPLRIKRIQAIDSEWRKYFNRL